MGSRINEYAYEASVILGMTVGTTSAVVLAANPLRRSAVVVNTGPADAFLAVGRTAESGKGICLKANGGSYEMHALNLSHAAVQAVTAQGTTSLSLHEGQ